MKKLLSVMLAGMVLFAACKGHGTSAESDSAKMADMARDAQDKLVKTASINFKVKNVRQCNEKIDALAKQFNGMVMHHDITSTAGNTKEIKLNDDSIMRVTSYESKGEMTVKIPSEQM